MNSIDLIRSNLARSRDLVLKGIEDMDGHALVPPTPRGGGHTLWVLGHLACVEGLVVHRFMRGEANPLADWEAVFDGEDVSAEPADYPSFEEVLARCREMRAATLALIEVLKEEDLDRPAAACPAGWEEIFGSWRSCLQYLADHFYMHRGQLADARRAAGIDRMWV